MEIQIDKNFNKADEQIADVDPESRAAEKILEAEQSSIERFLALPRKNRRMIAGEYSRVNKLPKPSFMNQLRVTEQSLVNHFKSQLDKLERGDHRALVRFQREYGMSYDEYLASQATEEQPSEE